MVNQRLKQLYSPNEDPIGRRLLVGNHPFEIIGIVANVRGTGGSITNVGPEVYWTSEGEGVTQRYFVVRSKIPPEQLIKVIQEQVHAVDPQQGIGKISTMEDLISEAVAQPWLNMALMASFSSVALLLACIGIYGVVAYSVTQRTQEIGVRMALGATRRNVSVLFIRHAMVPALVGLGAGTCIALVLTKLLRSQLYGVTPDDPFIYLAAITLLIVPVFLAILWPTKRATTVNPAEVLAAE